MTLEPVKCPKLTKTCEKDNKIGLLVKPSLELKMVFSDRSNCSLSSAFGSDEAGAMKLPAQHNGLVANVLTADDPRVLSTLTWSRQSPEYSHLVRAVSATEIRKRIGRCGLISFHSQAAMNSAEAIRSPGTSFR